jgi:hypothetical protein
MGSNLSTLSNDANGVIQGDSVSFTPVANTTYLIITEMLPLPAALQPWYKLRAWLVDPATNVMLTRPLEATVGNVNIIAAPFRPAIQSAPASTSEEWDNFYAIDYSDSVDFISRVHRIEPIDFDRGQRAALVCAGSGLMLAIMDACPDLRWCIDVDLLDSAAMQRMPGWVTCVGNVTGLVVIRHAD